jgi:4-amino-4-deoxy-L-arabinose transferase-like glycosyltransferase
MTRFLSAVFQNWTRTLLAIFVIALLVRSAFILTLQDRYYFPDSVDYSRAAVSLISSGELGETYKRPPGYPVFLAGIYLFFGESIFAVRMVESVLGAFLAVVIALVGRRMGGEVVGLLSGLLWSIYPIGIFIAGLVYPETLLTTLLACGVLGFLPYAQGDLSRKRVFLTGVLWGLAALTKPIVLATLGAVSLWVFFWGRGSRLLVVSLLFLGSALTVVPWGIRDYYVYDRLVIVEPRAVQHLPRMRSAERELRDKKIEAILQHPGEFAGRFVGEFLHFWKVYPDRVRMSKPDYRERMHAKNPQVVEDTIFSTNNLIMAVSLLSTGPLFLFAILGTVAMWLQRERRGDLWLLWGTILSFAVTYSFFFTETRYRIPIEPYIAILSAYGLKKTWDLMAARFGYGQAPTQAKVQAKVKVERQVKVKAQA